MNYDRSQIQRIKDANPIADVIAADVELRRSGSNLVGHCQQCTGKKPKLTVTPSKGMAHCFRCGAHYSDVVAWVMERQNLTFPAALEWLSRRAAISV